MLSHFKLVADPPKDSAVCLMAVWGKLYVHLRDPGLEKSCFDSAKSLNNKIADKLVEPQNFPFFPPVSLKIIHELVT